MTRIQWCGDPGTCTVTVSLVQCQNYWPFKICLTLNYKKNTQMTTKFIIVPAWRLRLHLYALINASQMYRNQQAWVLMKRIAYANATLRRLARKMISICFALISTQERRLEEKEKHSFERITTIIYTEIANISETKLIFIFKLKRP